ncbi:drebrin-like isoform X11 [Dermochelys coriacea]|uniref:drebrin-like isoform X11 n=1 Tax=Dermochelys coriacea TaxID=27794 RepID=UPI001CA8AB9E|nr:drebrin-like isoform X11 [Dermochelys coriacea]
MSRPDLDTHRLALLAAREDIVGRRASTGWAIFAYGKHNELKLLDSGAGGADELARKFSSSNVMYGLCRAQDPGSGQPHVVLISWVGEKVPESYRQTCAGHLPAIKAFFKEASLVLSARRPEEVTQEGLHHVLSRLAPAGGSVSRQAPASSSEELVGTNYRKTNPALEIRRTKRDSFWAQAEREEEQRKEEERRRLLEERRRWERERMEEEKREAAERERKFKEKERLIEEQRKEQARLEAEERRKEKARWEQQQREHEEAMRDRFRRSESIEKAVEAATLVSRRSQNPREFFRQREHSSSTSGAQSPPSPLGVRPGAPHRPYLRYQRSLTESAYIFRRPEPPTSPGDFLPAPSSPHTSESCSSTAAPPVSPRRPTPLPPASLPGTGPLSPTSPTWAKPLPPTSPRRTGPLSPTSSPWAKSLPPTSPPGTGPLSPISPPWAKPLPPTSPPRTGPLPPAVQPRTKDLFHISPDGTMILPPISLAEPGTLPPAPSARARSPPPASPPRAGSPPPAPSARAGSPPPAPSARAGSPPPAPSARAGSPPPASPPRAGSPSPASPPRARSPSPASPPRTWSPAPASPPRAGSPSSATLPRAGSSPPPSFSRAGSPPSANPPHPVSPPRAGSPPLLSLPLASPPSPVSLSPSIPHGAGSLNQPPATFLPMEEGAPCMDPLSLQGPSESSLLAELVPTEGPHGRLPDVQTGPLSDPTNPLLAMGEPAPSCPVLSSAGSLSVESLPQPAPSWPWQPGTSTAAAPMPGKDPGAGGEAQVEPPHGPRPAPGASPAELLLESGHNGIARQEARRWPELTELEPGETGALSGGAKLQLQAAWDPPAGGTAWVSLQGGARQVVLEGGEAAEGPSPPTA